MSHDSNWVTTDSAATKEIGSNGYHDSGLEIYCNSAWRSNLSWSSMFGVRLKEHLLENSRFVPGQTIADTKIQGSFWFLAEFWYLLGLLYSFIHTDYTFKMMTIWVIFFSWYKIYSACSLSFFNYPYVGPNVQTKLLSTLEPTHNLVLTKVSIGPTTYFSHEVFWAFWQKRVVLFKTIFDKALMLFWQTLLLAETIVHFHAKLLTTVYHLSACSVFQ